MYTPAAFKEERLDVLHAFMAENSFATIATAGPEGLMASHVPLYLDPTAGLGKLFGHIARSNPQRNALERGCESLAIFQGPQAYISPSFYPSKKEHGKVVPTWNYLAVHDHGSVRCLDDPDELIEFLTALTDKHERDQPAPWQVSDAPAEFIRSMAAAIVGFEIRIERLSGAWKLSQNRSSEDRRGVASGLQAGSDQDRRLGRLIPE